MINDFSKLDAQDEMNRLAQVGPHEQDVTEFDNWYAEISADDNGNRE